MTKIDNPHSEKTLSENVGNAKKLTAPEKQNIRQRITTLFNAICADHKPRTEHKGHIIPHQNAVYTVDANGLPIKNVGAEHKISAQRRAIGMASETPGKFFGVWNNEQNTVQMYYRLAFSERKKTLRQIFKNMGHSVFFRAGIKHNITEFDIKPHLETW